VPGGKPFRHVFRQGAAERAHAVEPDRTPIAAVRSRREEEQLATALLPQRDQRRQAVGRGVVRLVEEQGLTGEIRRHSVGLQLVEGRVRAGQRVVERRGLTQIGGDLLDSAQPAYPGSADQLVRDLEGRLRYAPAIRKGDDRVVAFDEPLLDLLL